MCYMIRFIGGMKESTGGDLLNLVQNECVLPGGVCAPAEQIPYLLSFMKKNDASYNETNNEKLINDIKEKLKVSSESEVWRHPEIVKITGQKVRDFILEKYIKPVGPCGTTEWLSNIDIDTILSQWKNVSKEYFNKNFLHVPFQTIDFQKVNGELSYLDLEETKKKYDCFGVVLNTDTSKGSGKHWFAIFGDLMHKGTKEDPYTLEYFNSSGNPPTKEVTKWMEEVTSNLFKNHGKYCITIHSSRQQLQFSNSECGIWSLIYIFSRLEGKSTDWYYDAKAKDKDMINIRKLLFRGCENDKVSIPITIGGE